MEVDEDRDEDIASDAEIKCAWCEMCQPAVLVFGKQRLDNVGLETKIVKAAYANEQLAIPQIGTKRVIAVQAQPQTGVSMGGSSQHGQGTQAHRL